MAFSSFLFLLLLLVGSSLGVDSAKKEKFTGPVINVTKHLSFPDFSLDNPRMVHDVRLLGSAKLSKETGAVQIPDVSEAIDLRHLAGRALYSSPVRLLDPATRTPASFETTFDFQFKNDSSVTPARNDAGSAGTGGTHGGSGLTFIIVPDEFTVGRSGPWLGMLNDACDEEYKAVAVEFDTRHNPEFGDPNDNHVGINLGSIVSTRTINLSDIGVSLKDGSIHRARIRYDGPKRWIEINLGSVGQEFPSTPAFSGFLDLSPHLKEYMFVGFSASTGNLTQIHNVLSWNFTSTSQASLRIPSDETCESKIILGNTQTPGGAKTEPISNFLIFAAVVVLALAILVSLYYNSKRRGDKPSTIVLPEKIQRPRPPNKPRSFTVNEVSCATRGFGEYEVLGSDYRGSFYRGKLPNGCQVAVKRFSTHFLNSYGLDRRRILKEICAISRIRHPNLVPIRGWCHDKVELMVIYDFFPNGSLDKWLFGVGVLPWTRRFKVIKDAAEALSFLHSKKLAHKNMKTTSVLLDVTFRAVLGDFGFVLSGSGSRKFESATSQAADVFEFGVIALEVIAGRRRSDPEVEEEEEKDLLDFSWRMHEINEKVKVFDRRMGSLVNLEQAIRVLEIGLLCTLNESKGRPSMEEVVNLLATDKPIPELPPSRPVALFPYSSTTGLCAGYSCAPFR
ncbi:probable L-type lectin-domain containing receptor kinase S.7 [Rhodamnia argentea]|uniref:non-specific serine/threonine protein kinase n=1 Tax=Rhodamnia argentea TaxID=178133 RepID=A0A8B8PXY5_9MYRT|nr:probable L-type lectin-domain containing receptor kinase S.7 [Rhodamnia argentea]